MSGQVSYTEKTDLNVSTTSIFQSTEGGLSTKVLVSASTAGNVTITGSDGDDDYTLVGAGAVTAGDVIDVPNARMFKTVTVSRNSGTATVRIATLIEDR